MIRGGRRPCLTAFRWIVVAGWAGIIWKLLTLPGEETPDISYIPLGDKLAHAALYFIWGLLVSWAVHRSFRALSKLGVGIVSVLAAAAYGAASEVYQAGIGRNADLLDVLADAGGAVAAQYLYFSTKVKATLNRAIPRRIISRTSLRRMFSPPASKSEHGGGCASAEAEEENG